MSSDLAWYLTLGMVATVNPCGFAMLPAYLSYFLGLDTDGTPGTDGAEESGGAWRAGPLQALRVALAVSVGFMLVFAVAGLAVRHTSMPIYEYAPWVALVIGIALVALGIAMLAGFELVVNLPRLDRGGRERTLRSMFLFGVSYAVASIGCTLPTFLAAVAGTMSRDSVGDGLIAFGVYALGMAIVLSALTVTLALARTSLVTALRSARRHVNRVAGGLVTAAGAYVIFYGALELRTYRSGEGANVPSSALTDLVADLSYDVNDWIGRVGATRFGVILAIVTAVMASLSLLVGRAVSARRR